jgi:hypothetical protein
MRMDRSGPFHIGRRGVAALLAMAGLAAVMPFAEGDAAKRTTKKRAVSARLASFDNCAELLRYARESAIAYEYLVPVSYPREATLAPGTPQPALASPAPAAQEKDTAGSAPGEADFSGTNNQEANVDEPDIVKTDGKRIFTLGNGRLQAVTVTEGKPAIKGSLELKQDGDASLGYGSELLLHGNRLLVLGTRYGYSTAAADTKARSSSLAYAPYSSSAVILEVDVSDLDAMKVTRTLTVDGRYVSGRATGDTARIVVTSPPQPIEIQPSDNQADYEAKRRAAIAAAPLSTFRPRVAFTRGGDTKVEGLMPCSRIRHPRQFSGLDTTTVLTIDLDKGLPEVDTDAVLGAGDTVYASTTGLYVASQRYDERFDTTGRPSFPTITTQIHRFAAGERGSTTYRASGSVRGYLLNQFSLSDYKGVLRVATTEEPVSFGDAQTESSSTLTVLDESDGRLVPIGRAGGLGKGERIYAVRFVDDVGYVVTFRQVDPLYTLDLSNPRDPKVLGELKILGYSAYLHPVGEDTILGIGQDASEQGRRLGTQLSLFDVSDLRNPRLLRKATVGGSSSSTVEYDHKAFLWWAPKRLAVLPVSIYDQTATTAQEPSPAPAPSKPAPAQPFNGVLGYRVSRASGVDLLGRMSDPKDDNGYTGAINRTLVFGGRLVTISDRGVGVGSLDTFAQTGFAAFPPVPPTAEPGPPQPLE